MKDAAFTGSDGTKQLYYMGCYGIGIGRTLATIAETHHNEKGLVWPEATSPYQVHLLVLGNEKTIREYAEALYTELIKSKIEVLFDDREVSAGIKFSDADLLGISSQIIVSKRLIEKDSVELFCRTTGTRSDLKREELLKRLGA